MQCIDALPDVLPIGDFGVSLLARTTVDLVERQSVTQPLLQDSVRAKGAPNAKEKNGIWGSPRENYNPIPLQISG